MHQLYLDTLIELFPDATLIYTYRPLTDVLRSHFSLVTTIFQPLGVDTEEFSDRLDFSPHRICTPKIGHVQKQEN